MKVQEFKKELFPYQNKLIYNEDIEQVLMIVKVHKKDLEKTTSFRKLGKPEEVIFAAQSIFDGEIIEIKVEDLEKWEIYKGASKIESLELKYKILEIEYLTFKKAVFSMLNIKFDFHLVY
jgi:hypothetical protein